MVDRVSDSDSGLLRYLTSVGLCLGTPILVVGRENAAGLIFVLLEGSEEPLAIGVPAAHAVWVEPLVGA